MKIVFVSDIHGCYSRLAPVLDFFDSHKADLLCIGGDIINYGPRNGVPEGLDPQSIVSELNSRKSHIIAVRGNCDSEVDQMLLEFPLLADYAIVADGTRRFFITHGHLFNSGKLPSWSAEAEVIVSGHTHIWKLERNSSSQIMVNTGSVTFPKEGNVPTFGYYDGRFFKVLSLEGSVLGEIEC